MAATSAAERRSGGAWRLWALIPLLLLVGVVALFASSGTTLLDLVGRAPPALDQFDIRRVEFKPGEITIRVTNPQQKKLTIASVTVDDAIVPFHTDGPTRLEQAALEQNRGAVPVGRRRPLLGRRHELHRHRDDRFGCRLRSRRAARARAAFSATR